MLTADLVRAVRRGDELRLVALKPQDRAIAVGLAQAYLDTAQAHLEATRGELQEALADTPLPARLKRLGDGLRKLVLDDCEFEVSSDIDPIAARRAVFTAAADTRRAATVSEPFDRIAVLARAADQLAVGADRLEHSLYADLRSEHRVIAVATGDGPTLVERLERAQSQAVLLRAERVTAIVRGADPAAYRKLFHRLKFRRLLYTLEALEDGGYRIELDGPYSLFEAVTRYGLQLALVLPAIQACGTWSIEARVRWGKERRPLLFRLAGAADGEHAGQPGGDPAEHGPQQSPDIEQLAKDFAARKSPWTPASATAILALPGIGLTVPDLCFTHRTSGFRVFFEVLGFWSRDAVWRRVELVEKGLSQPVLFAVSRSLRVSEEALADDTPSALYVYRTRMRATEIERRLDQLAARAAGA